MALLFQPVCIIIPLNQNRLLVSPSNSRLLPFHSFSNISLPPKVFSHFKLRAVYSETSQERPPPPFHLAIPVHDVESARDFYGGILGCPEGRSAKTWVDFNLYGHQVVCHYVPNYNAEISANPVDGDPVPVPHFGLAMTVNDFLQLAEHVKAKGIQFIIEPHIRFKGQPGEQWTMFFKDQSGNSLEFKAMTNPNNLFAKYVVKE